MESSLHIHHAPWVVPVTQPPIADGGVAVHDNLIVGVGSLAVLRKQYPAAGLIAHANTVLTPPLVNGHIHLELSHLASLTDKPVRGDFTAWISRLITLRDQVGAIGEHVETAAIRIAEQQYAAGVSVLADIGNTETGHSIVSRVNGLLLPFKEYLGLPFSRLHANLARLAKEQPGIYCSGHAPYSTHGELLKHLKSRATAYGYIFPIHLAETAAEIEMLRYGTGELVEFLKQRGFWDDSFEPPVSAGCGAVQYLDQLGLLDEHTLCVHGIHVSEAEIELLSKKRAKVCLCPCSNKYLDVGIAPVGRYLHHGILPALGTDSVASNPELSLWREMQSIAEDHQEVDHSQIFSMATLGGARAFGLEERLGSLEPGKSADFLGIHSPAVLTSADKVYTFLVTTGQSIVVQRIDS